MADGTSYASQTSIIPAQKGTQPNNQLFLDALELGISGTMVVMICRRWDVNARTGRYISTDFIVFDAMSSTFICNVTVNNVITRKGWNYPSCGGGKCKKGLSRQGGKFWCDGCNTSSDYPVIRYRLELSVSDETEQTVVVLFDETATELVKHPASSLFGMEEEDQSVLPRAIADIVGTTHKMEIKTHTYYEHGSYESFTCSAICADQPTDASKDSSMVDQSDAYCLLRLVVASSDEE